MSLFRKGLLFIAGLIIFKLLSEGASLCLHFPDGDSYCLNLVRTKTNSSRTDISDHRLFPQ